MDANRIDTNLTYLLARAHRRLHSGLETELQKDELTVEQWRVLEVLSDREGRSMGTLAELVLMNHPALTKMADRMVVNGLIHRAPDPQDQRRGSGLPYRSRCGASRARIAPRKRS